MKYYIGVDLGGTSVKAGVVSERGKLIHKDSMPTGSHKGQDAMIADIVELCQKVAADSGIGAAFISSIGIGVPGLYDKEQGVIIYLTNLDVRQVPIRSIIQKTFDVPVYLENDANAAAMGESVAGAAKEAKSSVTVTLGTGVGGGIIIDNKILNGAFGGAGEIGHMAITIGGERCNCGRFGCWEAYASAAALIRQAKAAATAHPESRLAQNVGNDLSRVTGKAVFDAVDQGDETAIRVLETYLRYVAVGITSLIAILEPEMIVIGGGLSAQGDKLLAPITKMVEEEVFGGIRRTKIAAATLENDAGIIGAAMLGMGTGL